MAKVSAADIAKMPNTDFGNSNKKDRFAVINAEHHYELQSNGLTLDVTNDRGSADFKFAQCNCSNKTLYENKGGEKWILRQRLG